MSTGAILLAGGRARRLDGVAKPLLEVGGRSLLSRAIAAVADSDPLTIVGDAASGYDQRAWVREEPAFAGPAAAVVAGLRSWPRDPEWTFVLACDLPAVAEATRRLRAARDLVPHDTDGLCLADVSSRPQWLTGLYRTAPLRRAAEAMADEGRDAAVRDLFADAAIAVIPAPADETDDVDTWDDLTRARARYGDAVADDEEER